MTTSVISLLIFFGICLLAFFFFRSDKGIYWRIQRSFQQDTKIIIEDVLKMLYHTENNQEGLSVNSIFDRLKFNKKKLLEILQIIEAEGLVISSNDKIKLSPTGRDYALKIIRAHRLWEKYLSEQTGYDKLEWHDRAEEMEHHLSEEELNQLAIQLGNPRFDPHGDPIPSSGGEMHQIAGKPLPSFPVGTIGKITHIEDEPEIIYQQILAEDLHIGSQIKIIESNKKRIKFHSVGEEYILAPIVAANITIEVLKREDVSNKKITRLSNLKKGEKAIVVGISQECKGDNRRRLLDLGIVMGTEISIELISPLNDPKAYLIRDTVIAFRADQAAFILIEKLETGKANTAV